ncbi:MAG: hypothetical protein IJC45_09460 [Clostridia bacterium]|nr:hypothetical protein [Clostridia bacterium]
MFDILIAVLSVCVFVWWTKITFKLAWGTAKILATVLAVSALVVLILCLVFAGGLLLLIPLGLLLGAVGIIKAVAR